MATGQRQHAGQGHGGGAGDQSLAAGERSGGGADASMVMRWQWEEGIIAMALRVSLRPLSSISLFPCTP